MLGTRVGTVSVASMTAGHMAVQGGWNIVLTSSAGLASGQERSLWAWGLILEVRGREVI